MRFNEMESSGLDDLIIIAGPCAVESRQQILNIAREVKEAGATHLRGGTYKARTKPNSFQGLEDEGLEYLAEAKELTGLPIVSEIMDASQIGSFMRYGVDIVQVGARNMQNFSLLKALNKAGMPVLLKRGVAADLNELEGALSYLKSNEVTVCLRGLKMPSYLPEKMRNELCQKPFQKHSYRNVIDIDDTFAVKGIGIVRDKQSQVIFDPSHSCGVREDVPYLALQAIKYGADGVIVEVHNEPDKALCDANQQILPDTFRQLVSDIKDLRTPLRYHDSMSNTEARVGR